MDKFKFYQKVKEAKERAGANWSMQQQVIPLRHYIWPILLAVFAAPMVAISVGTLFYLEEYFFAYTLAFAGGVITQFGIDGVVSSLPRHYIPLPKEDWMYDFPEGSECWKIQQRTTG